eukprot:COSAG02_NODE_2746_length_8108_cov_37.665002_9_plen_53_part_01
MKLPSFGRTPLGGGDIESAILSPGGWRSGEPIDLVSFVRAARRRRSDSIVVFA